jgi:O-antigen/teichoic acid export membrane protein
LLSRLLLAGLTLGVGGILVAMIAGRQILTVLYRPEYGHRAELLVYLMVAAAFGYLAQFVGFAVTAARLFNPQLPLSILVTFILILACYLFVPANGVTGAVWAIVAAMAAQLVGYFFLLLLGLKRHGSLAVNHA